MFCCCSVQSYGAVHVTCNPFTASAYPVWRQPHLAAMQLAWVQSVHFVCCRQCMSVHPWSLMFVQAQRHTEAARLLVDTAIKLAQQRGPPLHIKKLYVLAALEVEAFKRKALAGAGGDGAAAAATLLDTQAGNTAAGPPGTTRGPGNTMAATARPAQTVAAAQTLAGE